MRSGQIVVAIILIYFGVLYFASNNTERNVERESSLTGTIITKEISFPIFTDARKVNIYLPDDYETSGKSYPVIYMHDGQNLFDDKSSYAGEWGVDETLSDLMKIKGFGGAIVVGIDNAGGGRMSEYAPWSFEVKKWGKFKGQGDAYVDYLANTLKPMIDAEYRTKKDAAHTAIIGSSMGGLISLYAGLKHPKVFGKVGALSSTLLQDVVGENMATYVKLKAKFGPQKIYMDIGDKEGGQDSTILADTAKIASLLKANGYGADKLQYQLINGGEHNEPSWRKRFGAIVLWLDL